MAISSFQFRNPILTMCRYEVLKKEAMSNQNIDISITKNVVRAPDSNEATVELLLQLNKHGKVVREDAAFFAEVAMTSIFTWDNRLSDSEVDSLLKYNAMSLLISYIRPVIANITYMSPVGVLNLPFINVMELVPDEQEKSNTETVGS